MALPTLSGVGRMVQDPELRFTSSGKAVARLRFAFSSRKKDEAGNWVDGDKLFVDGTLWDQAAESVCESLKQGDEVVVSGRLKQRQYEDRDGNNRTVFDLLVDSIGPSLRYATAKVQKMSRNSQGGAPAGGGGEDPWATSAPQSGGGGFQDDSPPF